MKKLFVLFAFFVINRGYSQNVIMKETIDTTKKVEAVGPNRKHFGHLITAYGFGIQSNNTEYTIKPFGSGNYFLGYRNKQRINKTFAYGFSIAYNYRNFHLLPKLTDTLPGPFRFDKESIKFNNIYFDLYQRINYGRRGNSLGKFIDVGFYGEYAFSTVYSVKHNLPANNNMQANKVALKYKNLNYLNPFNYGLTLRIGFDKYVFFGNYRISNCVKGNTVMKELPRISAGVEIAMY